MVHNVPQTVSASLRPGKLTGKTGIAVASDTVAKRSPTTLTCEVLHKYGGQLCGENLRMRVKPLIRKRFFNLTVNRANHSIGEHHGVRSGMRTRIAAVGRFCSMPG